MIQRSVPAFHRSQKQAASFVQPKPTQSLALLTLSKQMY